MNTSASVVVYFHLPPGVDGLWTLVNEGRYVWERRAGDPDFTHVRIGLGSVLLAAPLSPDLTGDPLVEYEPDRLEEATQVYERYGELEQLSVTVGAGGLGSLVVIGAPDATRAWTGSVVCSMAALHAPDDLKATPPLPRRALIMSRSSPEAGERGAGLFGSSFASTSRGGRPHVHRPHPRTRAPRSRPGCPSTSSASLGESSWARAPSRSI